ncbi:MAG: hypothetical protein JSV80_08110 [Acidobacteriota bacterium]|nr:MAG: hypothetical protein JSV80_08110 [Acidobacteriota bacterium]
MSTSRPFRIWRQQVRASLAAIALAIAPAALGGSPPPVDDPPLATWAAGIRLMELGATNEALEWFLARHRERPEDPCGFYYPALLYAKHNLDGMDWKQELERGRALIDEGIEIGNAVIDAGAATPAARFCLGALYGMRAEDRVTAKHYFGAAFDGKRMRRLMLDLLEEKPQFVEARFWLGTYDYFADILPSIIKFFRTLLFLPSGDRERGLAGIETAARSRCLESYSAYWVLSSIYGDEEFEADGAKADRLFEEFHEAFRDSIQVTSTLAWRRANLPPRDVESASKLLQEYLARIAASSHAPRQRLEEKARVSLGWIYEQDLRPDAAFEIGAPAFETAKAHEHRAFHVAFLLVHSLNEAGRHGEATELVRELEDLHPGSSQLDGLRERLEFYDEPSAMIHRATLPARRLARDGKLDEAKQAFEVLLTEHGKVGQIYFWMGDVLNHADRCAEAAAAYRKVVRLGQTMPAKLLPLALLRLGNLLDLRGDHAQAKKLYRRAAASGEYEDIRRAAEHFQKSPFTRQASS